MPKQFVALAMVCIVLSTPAQAEADANTFLQRIAGGDRTTLLVLDAYGNGMSWLNVDLGRSGLARYCQGNISLVPEQTADLLKRYVEQHPRAGNLPAGAALYFALKETFPCSPTKGHTGRQ